MEEKETKKILKDILKKASIKKFLNKNETCEVSEILNALNDIYGQIIESEIKNKEKR